MMTNSVTWLTFGLDRVGVLERMVAGVPLYQYLASLIYVFLAFLVAKTLDVLIRGRLKRWAERTRTRFDDLLLELLRGPIKVVAFVLLLHVGLMVFSWPPWFENFLSKGLTIVVAVSLTYMGLKVVDLATGLWRHRAKDPEDESFNEQLLPIIRNTFKVFLVVVAVLLTLQNLGLNVTSLIASLGVGGLALALAAQDTLANIFGAVVVLLDKPFRIGDTVRVDAVEGKVEAIGFRSTRVRTADGFLVSIPNKTVGNAIVTNISNRPHFRVLMNIGLSYDTPLEKVQRATQLLEEICQREPQTKEVLVTFNQFGDSALNVQVVHLWNGTDGKAHLKIVQRMNLAIKEEFERAGIDFAYPTRTIYLKQDGAASGSEAGRRLMAEKDIKVGK